MTIKNEIPIILSTSLAPRLAVDGSAVLGAFVGAVLYSAIVSDSSIRKRVVFMLASFFAGYLGSPLFEIATDEEISLHKELRKYRVLLNRVSNQEGWPLEVTWPDKVY